MTDPIIHDPRVQALAGEVPFPLVFATVSGAHLYGFASADSDVDLRGAMVRPAIDYLGLEDPVETTEVGGVRDGLEVDLVTHDVRKFMRMMLRKNGYVLEQLYSPLVVATSPAHAEMKAIGRDCITRYHGHHYLGFAATQWKLFTKERPPRVKPLLYLYRVLLTGVHLMRTGEVEAHLPTLNDAFRLPQIADLIALKRGGAEKETLPEGDLAFHEREHERLRADLESAMAASNLPEAPTGRRALDDLLRRIRQNETG